MGWMKIVWVSHYMGGLGAVAPTTDSGGLASLWLLIWQVLNRNDNANNKPALTKQFKQ